MVKRVSMIIPLVIAFFTPLIYFKTGNELFEFPKMHFVYFVGGLFLFFYFIEAIYKNKKVIKPPLPVTVFFLLFLVSTLTSSHFDTSVWGYFSRFNGGLVSLLVMTGIYLALSDLKTKHAGLEGALVFAFIGGLFVTSLLSLLQHYGFAGGWEFDVSVRSFATFGQPNWYAAYSGMLLCVVLSLFVKAVGYRRVVYGLIFFWGFCGFWFTFSLSGYLGFFAGAGLAVYLNRSLLNRKSTPLLVALFLACFTFMVLNPGIFSARFRDAVKDARDVLGHYLDRPVLAEGPSASENGGYKLADSGFIRTSLWRASFALAFSSPKVFLLGSGPETFPYAFQPYRPALLNYSSEWNYILNKPHNYYLELLTQDGVLGLLSYAGLMLYALKKRHRVYTPALVAIFVSNFFGWPTVSTALLFWVFLSFSGTEPRTVDLSAFRRKTLLLITALPCVLLLWVVYSASLRFFADVYSYRAASYFGSGELLKANNSARNAVRLNPSEPYYYRQKARIAVALEAPKKDTEALLLKSVSLNPKNLATLRGLVPIYYLLAVENIYSDRSVDPGYREKALNFYRQLKTSFPDDVGVISQVAKYEKLLGAVDDYEQSVARIRILRPDLLEWYLL